METSPQEDYRRRLKVLIQERFLAYIRPLDVLHIFHKYDFSVLSRADMDIVKAVTSSQGDYHGSVRLLELLSSYETWFSCLLCVLRDPMVKLLHVADAMEEDKATLDSNIQQGTTSPEEEIRKLKEQLQLKDQRISELERGTSGEYNCSSCPVPGTQKRKRKLTVNLYTELESLDHTIEQELGSHEEKVRKLQEDICQKDQIISELRSENSQLELEKKEMDQKIKRLDTELAKAAAGTLQCLLSCNRRDGATLLNSCVRCWMLKKDPDIARKYSITTCFVPEGLDNAVSWMTSRFWLTNNYRQQLLEEVKQNGVVAQKENMENYLKAIRDQVNNLRDNEDEDLINGVLHDHILNVFSCCYVCFIGLETHGLQQMVDFMTYCRDSICHILDPVVDDGSIEWDELMWADTWQRFYQMPNYRTLLDQYVKTIQWG